MLNIYEQADRNKRRSLVIMIIFVAFFSLVAYVFGQASGYGSSWVSLALIFSGLMSFGSYYWSDKIILTISGARPATKKEYFNFYTVAENLAIGVDLPIPRLYVINDSATNAFATGRDPQHAVICATTGLLEKLDRTELEGVIAHEMSHIKNYDIRLMSVVAVLVGTIALLADWFLRGQRWGVKDNDREGRGSQGAIMFILAIIMSILAPLIAQLIQLAISRRREYLADASSAMITKYPKGLISALKKLEADKDPLEAANRATAHLYIVNPFKGRQMIGKLANLFNTHPPIEGRIKALEGKE